jgi:HK97 family phage portal protein
MSIIGSALRNAVRSWVLPEYRTSLENPSTPLSYPAEWLLDIFNGGRTDSGIRVSEMTALQVSTVFACVQLISSAIGFLPLHVFEWIDTADRRPGKRIAYEHNVYDLLRYEPNPEMTALTFRKTLQSHALLWGNLYAEIQRDKGNSVLALWPRNPARTKPRRVMQPTCVGQFGEVVPAGTLIYETTEGVDELTDLETDAQPLSSPRLIAAEDMIHVPGLALDGRLGQSVIWLTRQAVGLALATEKYGSKYFGNGARPGGVVTHPGKLSTQARENLKRSWQEAQGGENAHKTAVLEEGMKFEAASSENEAAQFLQTRQFQKDEICSIFSVPPHMIGDTGKQNRANTEQIGLEFVTFTLGPWLESWTQELKRRVFPKMGRTAGKYFPKFETRQLAMPDAESRRNFYATVKQWGVGSTNDIREMEDWNPVDDPAADALWMPVNMTAMGGQEKPQEVVPPADEPPDEPAADEPSAGGDKTNARVIRLYSRIFRDAIGRILKRRNPDSETIRLTFGPILCSIAEACGGPEIAFDGAPGFESSRFAADYLNQMATRVQEWRTANGELDALSDRELARAAAAIRLEVRFRLPVRRSKLE